VRTANLRTRQQNSTNDALLDEAVALTGILAELGEEIGPYLVRIAQADPAFLMRLLALLLV
jgi:hypothetical protein